MSHPPIVPDRRPVCAQSPSPSKQVSASHSGRKKPTVVKVGGLTIIEDLVIPQKGDSRPPGQFLSLSGALLRCKDVTAAQKNILAALIDRLGKNDRAWPSMATLALDTGLAKSTVTTAVQQLEERGLLIIDEGGGRRRSNRYYVTQLAYPCQLSPEVLCDRTSCPGECPWSVDSVQAALTPSDAPKLPEKRSKTENINPPDTGDFDQETHRNPVSIDPETPRNPVTNQDTNNTQPRKEGGKKPSAASGGGDVPAPSSGMTSPTSADSLSAHQELKQWFCQKYETAFGKTYRWQAKDAAILKKILGDGYNLVQVKAAVEAMFQDPWAVDGPKVSMQILSSKFNQYLPASGPQGLPAPSANAGGSWDEMAVEVHTLPVDGEEPAAWSWPLQHTIRFDVDIPREKQDWHMSQFSGDIIRQAERWLSAADSWALTMSGPPGNGKSTVAAAILQSYRDRVFPADDNRKNSVYVSFEEFERFAVLDNVNPDSNWVEKPTMNQEFLNDLACKKMLVLDDVGNRPMSKLRTDALHALLRRREEYGSLGYKTIVTTNRTIAELGQILGASVSDRIAGGIMLRFVDGSLRGQTNSGPLGLPAPEGDDLVKAATANFDAMQNYILHGPRAFQRPRSFENVATAFSAGFRENGTVESIAGEYWYYLCMWVRAEGQPPPMPVWEALFWAIQTLADTVGGLRNAEQYLRILTQSVKWHEAASAIRTHDWASDPATLTNETLFLTLPVWNVMAPIVAEMTPAA